MASIAWLITGRPRTVWAGNPSASVSGEVAGNGQSVVLTRRPLVGLSSGRRLAPVLPTCSYLRARDRVSGATGWSGHIARSLSAIAAHQTTDAIAAEALVSIVEACCDDCLAGEVLLIEEPELLLTPQAQRYLYRLLRRFAENGNQVLYSTRSPAFVDAAQHDEILRLDLRHGERSIRRTSPRTLSDPERVRLAAEFDHERSEMFFARAVVFLSALSGTPHPRLTAANEPW